MKVANTSGGRANSGAYLSCKQFQEAQFPRQDAAGFTVPWMVEDALWLIQQIPQIDFF